MAQVWKRCIHTVKSGRTTGEKKWVFISPEGEKIWTFKKALHKGMPLQLHVKSKASSSEAMEEVAGECKRTWKRCIHTVKSGRTKGKKRWVFISPEGRKMPLWDARYRRSFPAELFPMCNASDPEATEISMDDARLVQSAFW
ncbi:unnamed protein product [Durusdinium trenchii]|uniref:Uncharacterized protein n=1 Tax=Durusdinium trenchii TaxID=1381693 RepID=A0ABP0HV90_9DINO